MSIQTTGEVLVARDIAFEFERLVREKRSQVFEENAVFKSFGRKTVNFVDFD